jgi:hypothetical protein
MRCKHSSGIFIIAFSFIGFGSICAYSQSTISLIGFNGIGIPIDLTRSIEERIESGLPGYCQCPVISQQELDGTILEFLKKRVNTIEITPSRLNSSVAVEKIVTGTLSRVGPSYSMVLKLIEVKTGIIERSVRREHSGSIEALFQFTDATVAALFEEIKPFVKVDTLFIPIAAAKPTVTESQLPRKEATSKWELNSPSTASDDQKEARQMMEKIGIGAIAIFAAIAAILLTNIAR